MANDLPNPALTDSAGNYFVGSVDPSTGHMHTFEAGSTTAITGSATFASSARLVVEMKDGGDATQGAQADAAYAGSGNSTIIAALKGVYGLLSGLLSTKVVDSAGTNKLAVDSNGKIGVSAIPAIPAGSNLIGGVEVYDSAGTNKLAVNASGQIAISNYPATQPVSGTVTANAGTNLNTSALALESGGNLASIASSNTAISTNTAHLFPAGSNTTLSSPPSQTTANTDTAITFSSTVNHFVLQNNSSQNAYYNLDAAASTGTFLLPPGAMVAWDWSLTSLHVLTAIAANVNGANGLVLIGRA